MKNYIVDCWLCAGDCSRAPSIGCGEKDVAQAAPHNGQYFTSPARPPGQTTLHSPYTTYWSDSRVSSVADSFGSTAIRLQVTFLPTATAIPTHSPLCRKKSGLEMQHILHFICTGVAISSLKVQFYFDSIYLI